MSPQPETPQPDTPSLAGTTRLPGTTDVLLTMLDPGLPAPAYEHPGDAGMDLRTRMDVRLEPGERATVPTGVSLALPSGFMALVCPRSGLAARVGLGVVNGPGVVDAGYRGEISVVLVNHDRYSAIELTRGERIAQLVVTPVARVHWVPVASLPGSQRSTGGFGSTGGQ